jgi:hypothetical protein
MCRLDRNMQRAALRTAKLTSHSSATRCQASVRPRQTFGRVARFSDRDP